MEEGPDGSVYATGPPAVWSGALAWAGSGELFDVLPLLRLAVGEFGHVVAPVGSGGQAA